jgi:hypothetical protein
MQYARGTITHECEECGAPFASRDDLDRHEREECPEGFTTLDATEDE